MQLEKFVRIVLVCFLAAGVFLWLGFGASLFFNLAIGVSVGAWLVRPRSSCTTVFVFLVLVFSLAWHVYQGSMASGKWWLLRIVDTPAGTSSCTSAPFVDLPYNPNGFLAYTDPGVLSDPLGFCPYPEFRWANATRAAFRPTSWVQLVAGPPYLPCSPGEECIYASQNPGDYLLNLGRGLYHGYRVDANLRDTALCPGVQRTMNAKGVIGTGRLICTRCTQMFVDLGIIPPQPHCSQTEYAWGCSLCGGWSWVSGSWDADVLRGFTWWSIGWLVVVALGTLAGLSSQLVVPKNKKIAPEKNIA